MISKNVGKNITFNVLIKLLIPVHTIDRAQFVFIVVVHVCINLDISSVLLMTVAGYLSVFWEPSDELPMQVTENNNLN